MKRFIVSLLFIIPISALIAQQSDTITDLRDGKKYKIVKLGNQWWMAENLNAGIFVMSIYTETYHSDVYDNDIIEKYCFNNDINYCNTIGGFYEWNEMMSYNPSDAGEIGTTQGVCPAGWHIPTDKEWKVLEMFLGMSQTQADSTGWRGTNEGGKLKETGTLHWASPNTGATNESGFTALPTSNRAGNGYFYTFGTTHHTTFWTATAEHDWDGVGRQLYNNQAGICRGTWDREDGFPVRCVKDPCFVNEIIIEKTDISCYDEIDGSITINITGTGSFSIKWSTNDTTASIHNLDAGWYEVTVTDSSQCSMNESIQIFEPDLLTAAITDSSNTSSSGALDGTATTTPSGGTPPYSYLWDNSLNSTDSTATGLTDNVWYHVSISDANMCTTTDSVILSVAETFHAEITDSSNISCQGANDGTATVMITGGMKPYQISWDDDAGSSTATVINLEPDRWYHVTVSDKIMQTTKDSMLLTEPDAIIINKEYSPKVCQNANNGYIELTISGGTLPYTYDWNTGDDTSGIYNLGAGEYFVTITDANSCITTDAISIDNITTYQDAEICLVTVNNQNKIIVVWEKTYGEGIQFYNIYREQTKDNYVKIGTVHFDSLSIFVDDAAVPEENAYFYKISVTDSCGNESSLSPYHKSIHLQTNMGLTNEVNLNWDEYEGFEFYEYEIYRGPALNNLFSIRTITSSIRAWTDKTPPAGTNYYRIMVVKPEPCFPTRLKSDEYSSPFSNYDEETLVNIDQTTIKGLRINPNPFNEVAVIYFQNPTNKKYCFIMTDLAGKIVREINGITEDWFKLNRENLPSGIYLIELRGPEVYRGKIIIE